MRKSAAGEVIAVVGVLIAGLAQVSAADLPAKAPIYKAPVADPPSWTGFYIGANVGDGWGSRDVDFAANDPMAAAILAAGLPPTSFGTSGVLGGLQFGYNWQFNRTWLIGLETDYEWSGMKGSASSTNPTIFGEPVAPVDERIDWFGTVRARLGYLPTDNLLAYVTGGFAYGQVEHSGTYSYTSAGRSGVTGSFSAACGAPFNAPTCFSGSSRDIATGWTVGGGFEYSFWQKWSVKAEYLYVSLASKSLTETALVYNPAFSPASINTNFSRTSFNVARLGLNYHF